MDLTRDHYHTLKIKKDAGPMQIKRAYRKMALQWHPDRVPEEQKKHAEEVFKEVVEAYYILSDEKRREQYDRERGGALKGETSSGFYSGFSAEPIDENAFETFFKEQFANKDLDYFDPQKIFGSVWAKIIAVVLLIVMMAFYSRNELLLKVFPSLFGVPIVLAGAVLFIVWDDAKDFLGDRSDVSDTIVLWFCWSLIILTVLAVVITGPTYKITH